MDIPTNFIWIINLFDEAFNMAMVRNFVQCNIFANSFILLLNTAKKVGGVGLSKSIVSSSYVLFRGTVTAFHCNIFYRDSIKSSQKVARSSFMHSIHCGGAIFPYQALERRPAQEALIGCAGLHKKFEGINIHPVYHARKCFG
jgi:hypothetical protein